MIEAFRAGQDLHAQTAVAVLGKSIAEVTKADVRPSARIDLSAL